MSERYSKLFALPENLYATGSPVVIAAGALLKDTQTGKVLAQLKLRNIGKKTIKAATVSVEPLDTVGKPLGAPVTYQYLDLHADRDADFGQKTPIALPDSATRSFAVSVTQVIFADNTIWNTVGGEWKPLNHPQQLEALGDNELAKQFHIEYGGGCENLLLEQKDLWHCVCGAVNHQEETNCHRCHKALVELQAIDMEDLRKKKEERVANERAEAEVARKEAEIAAAKIKKIGMISAIAVAILVVIVVAANAISGMVKENNAYKDALALMDAGQYEEAIAAFEAMDGYKDSEAKIATCNTAILDGQYDDAIVLMNAGQYDDAIAEFNKISTHRDSAEIAEECLTLKYQSIYEEAVSLENSGKIAEAAMLFGSLGTFSDSDSRSLALWEKCLNRKTIAIQTLTAIAIQPNGRVAIAGWDAQYYSDDTAEWTDIVEVAIGDNCIVGLRSNGTIVSCGYSSSAFACSHWTGIVSVSVGRYDHVVGLRKDGTVIAVGEDDADKRCLDVSEWYDIVEISAGTHSTVGLKSDGTVVVAGKNEYGECDVSDWTDIVAISGGSCHTVGLKSDGTVVVAGAYSAGDTTSRKVSKWLDIVAISAGGSTVLGLKADGSVVIRPGEWWDLDVSDWVDIVEVACGNNNIIGRKADGSIIVEGNYLGGSPLSAHLFF